MNTFEGLQNLDNLPLLLDISAIRDNFFISFCLNYFQLSFVSANTSRGLLINAGIKGIRLMAIGRAVAHVSLYECQTRISKLRSDFLSRDELKGKLTRMTRVS